MRVLVFGSSSAEGFWDSRGGWPARLRSHYDKQKIDDPSIRTPWLANLGISGNTVQDIIVRFKNETEARLNETKKCCFIIQVGSNNAAVLNGKMRSTSDDYKNEMAELINMIKQYSKKIIIVGFHAVDETKTCPVPWADLYYHNEDIRRFEDVAYKVAKEQAAAFVPLHEEFKNSRHNLLAHDGLHPNDAGHELIFKLVQPELDKLLNT